jgi:uncharacterized membrane protein YkvA (DUF1232 family)
VRGFLIGMAVAAGIWVLLVAALFLAGRRSAARELVGLLPNLLVLFRELIRDRRVPRSTKLLLVLGMTWLASPIDLIPEFIPVLGPLDDAIVAALLLRHLIRRAGREVVSDHWRGDPRTLQRILSIAGGR